MKSFLTYLIESNKKEKIAYFPGSFKPPTKFHWDAIKHYAKIADKVYVVISAPSKKSQRMTKLGTPILPETSKKIFEIYKKADHLNNVEIVISDIPSPILWAGYNVLYNQDNAEIILGVSNKNGDENRYDSMQKLINRIEEEKPNIKFLDPKKYAYKIDTSFVGNASDVRKNIDDFKLLTTKYFPASLNKQQKQKVFDLLNTKEEVTEAAEKNSLNSARVGLEKINKLNDKKTRELFSEIKNISTNGILHLNVEPKTDGQAVRLAWDAENVYIESSHSGIISDPKKVYIKPFRKTLEYFQTPEIKEKLQNFLKGKENIGFKVFGELLYNEKDMRDLDNSITFVGTKYNSKELGDLGSIVLFDAKAMKNDAIVDIDESFKNKIIKFLVDDISNSEFSFFDNNNFSTPVDIKLTEFSEANQENIQNIDTVDKNQLAALRDEFNFILIDYCKKVKKPGIVLSDKTVEGLVFKIGDKKYAIQNPDWVTTKENFYKYTNEFNDVLMHFIKDVTGWQQRKKVLSVLETDAEEMKPRYLKLYPKFLKDLKVAYNNFTKNEKTIPRFVYLNNKFFIDEVYGKMSQINSDIESFKTALTPVKNESLNQITEGGNMFSHGKGTVRINQENVEATMNDIYEKVLPLLKVKQKDTAVLGSTGKKLPGGSSGDVDLAIDLTKSPYKDVDNFLDAAEKVAKELDVDAGVKRGLHLCSYRWPIANTDGKQEDEYVQLDLMPTDDIELMKWGMYSPHEKDYKFKGTVRNEFLNAIASFRGYKAEKTFKDENGEEHPLVWKRYAFLPQVGLKLLTKSREGKSAKKPVLKNASTIESKFISSDPDKIVKTILGSQFKADKILTGDDVFKAFKKTDLWKDPKIRDKIMAKVLTGLKNKDVKYPAEFDNALSDKSLLKLRTKKAK